MVGETDCSIELMYSEFLIHLGYNFDGISCESCKAFFRRNALKIPVTISHNEKKTHGESLCVLSRVN